jgi:hypothetical protein
MVGEGGVSETFFHLPKSRIFHIQNPRDPNNGWCGAIIDYDKMNWIGKPPPDTRGKAKLYDHLPVAARLCKSCCCSTSRNFWLETKEID